MTGQGHLKWCQENQGIQAMAQIYLRPLKKKLFNFNKNKQPGIHEIIIGDKTLIEAVV